MSTTLFAAFGILAPVHGFLRRLTTPKPTTARLRVPGATMPSPGLPGLSGQLGRPIELTATAAAQQPAYRARTKATARSRNLAHPPLRVVRVMESGQAAAHGGRVMISGRMADVCAELDRMAEREAAALQAGA